MLHHATNLDHRSRNCSRLHIIIIKIYVAITYHKWLTVTPVVSLSTIVREESHGIVRRHQFRVAVDKLCHTTRLSTWSGRIDSNHKLLTDSHRVGIVFSYSYKDTVKPGNIVCSKPVSWDCITIAYRRPSCYLAYTRKAIEFRLDNQNALKWAGTYVVVKVTEKGDIRSRKEILVSFYRYRTERHALDSPIIFVLRKKFVSIEELEGKRGWGSFKYWQLRSTHPGVKAAHITVARAWSQPSQCAQNLREKVENIRDTSCDQVRIRTAQTLS